MSSVDSVSATVVTIRISSAGPCTALAIYYPPPPILDELVRQFTKTYIFLPRKYGKSEMLRRSLKRWPSV